jgi:hypothetical protein
MSALVAMGNGLQAALRLAQGRGGDGMLLLCGAPEEEAFTARCSFLAALLCLPAFLCLRLIDWAQNGVPAEAAHGFALDLLGYAIGWAGFALLSHGLAARIGRQANWPRFIAAWNWCNAIQYLLLVAASLPVLFGLPDWVVETAWLVAVGWALWLEWYATCLSLEVAGLQAAGLVALDLGLGFLIAGVMGT